jgi:hypothetical protein
VQWFYAQGQLTGHEFYLSFWDWGGGGAGNEEYVLMHVKKTGLPSPYGFLEFADTLTAQGIYNQTCLPIVYAGIQTNTIASYGYQSGNICYFANQWTQWEFHIKINTPNNSDGVWQVWENGVLVIDKENFNITGTSSGIDMTGTDVEAGGWYTKNVWTNNGQRPSAGGTCSANPSQGSEAGAWVGTFNASPFDSADNCGPAPPAFSRYIDDIILLEK